MKDPEKRSPQEWAEELRSEANGAREAGFTTNAWMLSADDCDELAARMDDLAEALRLLREQTAISGWNATGVNALLAKYEEGQDDE